jgi:hypothetical protein
MTEARKTAVLIVIVALGTFYDFLYWLGFYRDET